jgi:hypothetical protein
MSSPEPTGNKLNVVQGRKRRKQTASSPFGQSDAGCGLGRGRSPECN